jgi:hypothetical protein
MSRLVFIIVISSLFASMARGQYNPVIRSARPGQSIGPFTVGARIFQVQSGVDAFGSKDYSTDEVRSGIQHNTVLRYGLSSLRDFTSTYYFFQPIFHP